MKKIGSISHKRNLHRQSSKECLWSFRWNFKLKTSSTSFFCPLCYLGKHCFQKFYYYVSSSVKVEKNTQMIFRFFIIKRAHTEVGIWVESWNSFLQSLIRPGLILLRRKPQASQRCLRNQISGSELFAMTDSDSHNYQLTKVSFFRVIWVIKWMAIFVSGLLSQSTLIVHSYVF